MTQRRTARIDLGKIYNATDIEVYFGWRAQARTNQLMPLAISGDWLLHLWTGGVPIHV